LLEHDQERRGGLNRGTLVRLLSLVALLFTFVTPGSALADATPTRVVLTYLDGTSNWGPKDASGIMVMVRQEGEVRLSARQLPAIPGVHYVLWITHEGSSQVYRLGEPTVRSDGSLVLDEVLPQDIPSGSWNLAMLTVEDTATPEQPGPRRSIAGRFPAVISNGVLPRNLPNTGLGGGGGSRSREEGAPELFPSWLISTVILMVVITLGCIVRTRRRFS
jgi:hypothetical protein